MQPGVARSERGSSNLFLHQLNPEGVFPLRASILGLFAELVLLYKS